MFYNFVCVCLCVRLSDAAARLKNKALDEKDISEASKLLIIHRLPIYMLAKDQTSAPDKTKSLFWPFFTECRGDLPLLKKLIMSMVSLCCDYGVEHIIPRMMPTALTDLFPWVDFKPQNAEPVRNPYDEFGIKAGDEASELALDNGGQLPGAAVADVSVTLDHLLSA